MSAESGIAPQIAECCDACAAGFTDADWREYQAIPEQGYSHRHWLNVRMAMRVEARIAELTKEAGE